ncbi:bleomycin resistance protein [Streptomyces coeruleorubidus]|uniref:bleomycin resistance protein n=1 Tax=Streptomyces coeruleorubidus TaxID=116188 RepID=UPI0037947777
MPEKTIPILPCQTLPPVLEFYTALGFEVTYQQRSPNPYAVVEHGGIELQFFAMKHYEPTGSISTCYILIDDVDGLYRAFRAGLKAAYGRIPTRGLPRVGPLKDMSYGVRQFLMTDPGGNCVRVGQRTGGERHHGPAPEETFARALHHASLLADSKGDAEGAAKVVDRVLRLTDDTPTRVQLLQLLVLHADIAGRLGDEQTSATALARAAELDLTEAERDGARDTLTRLEDLLASSRP